MTQKEIVAQNPVTQQVVNHFIHSAADYYQKQWRKTTKDHYGQRLFALTADGKIIADRRDSKQGIDYRYPRTPNESLDVIAARFILSLRQSGFDVVGLAECSVAYGRYPQWGQEKPMVKFYGAMRIADGYVALLKDLFWFENGYDKIGEQHLSPTSHEFAKETTEAFSGLIQTSSEKLEAFLEAVYSEHERESDEPKTVRPDEPEPIAVADLDTELDKNGSCVVSGLSRFEVKELRKRFRKGYRIVEKRDKLGTYWVKIEVKNWVRPHRQHNAENMARGEDHWKAVLTEEIVRRARKLWQPNSREYGVPALADRFNVEPGTLYAAVSGRTWRHVN